jgi:hypothetical protein
MKLCLRPRCPLCVALSGRPEVPMPMALEPKKAGR